MSNVFGLLQIIKPDHLRNGDIETSQNQARDLEVDADSDIELFSCPPTREVCLFDVIDWLIQILPFEEAEYLVFKPRITQVAKKKQKEILTWFVQNHNKVPKDSVISIINSFENHVITDPWISQILRILKAISSPDTTPAYVFTQPTVALHEELIQQCRTLGSQSRATSNPWLRENGKNVTFSGSFSEGMYLEEMKLDIITIDDSSQEATPTQVSNRTQDVAMNITTDLPDPFLGQVYALVDQWKNGEGTNTEPPKEINIFIDCSASQLERICNHIDFDGLSEVSICTACVHLASLGSQLSFHNSTVIAQRCLLPRVLALNQNAPRGLITCVKTMFEAYPQSLINAVLVPCLTHQSTGPAQIDITSKIVKEDMTTQNRKLYLKYTFILN